MLDAILAILVLTILAGAITSIVGIIIGFMRKRWRLAIIAGSTTGVAFVIFGIIAGTTAEIDNPDTAPTQVSVQQESPAQASIKPTATSIPEPTQISVPNLGISRAEIQEIFEGGYELIEKLDEGETVMVGSHTTGSSSMGLWGPSHNLEKIILTGSTQDPNAFSVSSFILLEAIIPGWWDLYPDWLSEGARWARNNPNENYEKRHEDKIITFVSFPILDEVALSIEAVRK